MYTVIGSTRTRAARVVWMLEEIGQPYELIPHRPGSAEVKDYNPAGKVPVLLVDGATLTDSTAILQFLADRHGMFTYPAGTLERARQDGFTQLILDEVEALLWTAARHTFILPEEMRVADIKSSLKWEFSRHTARLSARLAAGPFLMGAQMTVPDLILTHCLAWAIAAKFPETDARLVDYLAMMRARPAYQRTMAC